MKLRLVSKKLGSKSLAALAAGLSTKLGYKVFRSKTPRLNRNNIVYGDCKDKLFQYQWFQANQIPSFPYTINQTEAKEWISKGHTVFARTLTKASEGKGIYILDSGSEFKAAPVYTQYRKKKREYRVHVYKDQVVQVLEKRKRKDFNEENRDTRIRNTANGYVFCSDGVVEPVGIRELALAASKVTSSDFRGVDIGYNEKLNELFVIEVNSAPGIEGSNIQRYIDAIVGN